MFSIFVLLSFIIYIVVGMLMSKRVSGVDDYYVAGRNAPTILIVGTLVASYFSSVAFMGEVGSSYLGNPLIMLVLFVFSTSGYVIGAFLFGIYIRRSESLTLPEYFGKRFKSKRARRLAAITTIIGMIAYLVAVTQGGAVLLSSIFNVSYIWALLIMWAVYTSFTFLSGAKGVITTDTIMSIIFVSASIIASLFIIKATGGFPQSIIDTANLKEMPNILAWHGEIGIIADTPLSILAWAVINGIVWGLVLAVSPWQTSRYLMAKNEHVVIRSSMISLVVTLFLTLFLHIAVATLNLVNPNIDPAENAFVWAAHNIVPTWVGILVVVGLMAAVISSCSTFLQITGNSVASDLFNLEVDGETQDHSNVSLKISRVAMILTSIIVLFITFFQPPAILWFGYFAATLFAASWGPVCFASIHSAKVTEKAAFWSMLVGFISVFFAKTYENIFDYTFPMFFHPAIVGTIASLIILISISMVTKPTVQEVKYQQNILKIPKSFYNQDEVKVTKRYPIIVSAVGLIFIVITFIFYYLPANIY